jgi:CRISPR-associated protein Csb1
MNTENTTKNLTLEQLLAADGPACLIIKAQFEPVGDTDRFQPAGFPEMGHVIYDAPRVDEKGDPAAPEKVCIVDSAASMANHLETVCFANPAAGILHPDLEALPHVRCVTDRNPRMENGRLVPGPENERDRVVVTTLTEGHRLASDYFLDGQRNGQGFRELLRNELGIVEVKKDKTYFLRPDDWWTIYTTIFRYDPNSLVHGVMFAREQIKISRLLTAHLEAFGAARVGSAGVKFDRLGKTTSGQPIFAKDEETARRIEATFLIDLGLLRSYGHGEHGLNDAQKRLLLELTLWKIQRMLAAPFRFRSDCYLRCVGRTCTTDDGSALNEAGVSLNIAEAIRNCRFAENPVTDVYYAANELFNPAKVPDEQSPAPAEARGQAETGENEDTQQD